MTGTPLRVLYDLRGAQSPHHPERGIARWSREHAEALAERDDIDLWGLVDPAMPDPGLRPGAPIRTVAIADAGSALVPGRPAVHHVGSPFELDLSTASMLPGALQRPGVLRSATLFDVIPLAWPIALRGPARRWRVRAQLLRLTRCVLAISDFSARDAARRLGISPDRIHVVGTGVAPREAVSAPIAVPQEPYLLYAGGTEHPRKNLKGLVRAYALLAPGLREAHRLVIAGRIASDVVAEVRAEAASSGIADRVELTGYVSDERLSHLMAGCACFVYPSLYEGFGLPIVEAMQAGAPVVHSGTTSCGEIPGPPQARFDPADPGSIAGAMTRVLTRPGLAERLRARGRATAGRYRWDEVAERTVAAWRSQLELQRRRRRPDGPGAWTLTLVARSAPDALSPAWALQLLASAASRRVPVQLATPVPIRPRDRWMGPLAPTRHPVAPTWRPGALVHLVDTAEDAAIAARLLRGLPGAAIVWELDRVLGGDRRMPSPDGVLGLRRLATSTQVLVRDRDDAAWITRLVGESRCGVGILPMPLGWVASGGGLGHEPTLETAIMLGPGRSAVRRCRERPLVLTGRPGRLGALRPGDVSAAGRLADEMARRGVPVRVAALGTIDADTPAATASPGATGGADALVTGPWPTAQEMAAWATAICAVVPPPGASPSTRRALEDLAAISGVPVVGHDRRGVSWMPSDLGSSGAQPNVPPERRPDQVAVALLAALGRPGEPGPSGAGRASAR